MTFTDFLSRLDPASVIVGVVLCAAVFWVIGFIQEAVNRDDDDDDDSNFDQSLPPFYSTGGKFPQGFRLAGLPDRKLIAWCELALHGNLTLESCRKKGIGRRRFEKARTVWIQNGLLERNEMTGQVNPPTGQARTITGIMVQAYSREQARNRGGGVVMKGSNDGL